MALAAVAALAGLLALSGPVAAKKKGSKRSGIGGKLVVRVPAFDPETGTSLATGFVRAKHGCDSPRVVRFAYFTPAGEPLAAGQPAVVTTPGGSFIAALPRPDSSTSAIVIKTAVDARVKRSNGRRVRCRALRGPPRQIALTD